MTDFFNRIGQKQTAGAVLVQPDSQCSQHATAYLKSFWLIAYTYIPICPLSFSVDTRYIEQAGLSPAFLLTYYVRIDGK